MVGMRERGERKREGKQKGDREGKREGKRVVGERERGVG